MFSFFIKISTQERHERQEDVNNQREKRSQRPMTYNSIDAGTMGQKPKESVWEQYRRFLEAQNLEYSRNS